MASENMGNYGLYYWFVPKIWVNMDWIIGVCAKNMELLAHATAAMWKVAVTELFLRRYGRSAATDFQDRFNR